MDIEQSIRNSLGTLLPGTSIVPFGVDGKKRTIKIPGRIYGVTVVKLQVVWVMEICEKERIAAGNDGDCAGKFSTFGQMLFDDQRTTAIDEIINDAGGATNVSTEDVAKINNINDQPNGGIEFEATLTSSNCSIETITRHLVLPVGDEGGKNPSNGEAYQDKAIWKEKTACLPPPSTKCIDCEGTLTIICNTGEVECCRGYAAIVNWKYDCICKVPAPVPIPHPPSPIIETPSLPNAQSAISYSVQIIVTGGTPPYMFSSTALPPGLNLGPLSGVISGTPIVANAYNFTVRATDANLQTTTKNYDLTVMPALLLIITLSLPNAQDTVSYSEQVVATGGALPYVWTISSGSLPTGLTFNSVTGYVEGTPTNIETCNFTVEVTDSYVTPHTDQQPLSITVDPSPVIIITNSLSMGIAGVWYSDVVQAVNGVPPYWWMIAGGFLPPGLSLNPWTGVIDGIPGMMGIYPIDVLVMDIIGQIDIKPLVIDIF